MPPKITKVEPDRRLVVNAGQSKNLTCEASGDPKPNITWTREGFTEAQFNALVTSSILVKYRRKTLEDTNVLLIMDMALPLVSSS